MHRHTPIIFIVAALLCASANSVGATPSLTRISQAAEGTTGDGHSIYSAISADGTTVAYASTSTNLVDVPVAQGAAKPLLHLYVRDVEGGKTRLVSRAEDGAQANASSRKPDLSSNGRWLAFESRATNLVEGVTTKQWRIYVKNLKTGRVQLVSQPSKHIKSRWASISGDGRFVAFATQELTPEGYYDGHSQVYVRDLHTDELVLASRSASRVRGDDDSEMPGLSANGRYVVFQSSADNLVEQDTPHLAIFVKDLESGAVELASTTHDGRFVDGCQPRTSADGRRVTFYTTTDGIFPGTEDSTWMVAVKDLESGELLLASQTADGEPANAASTGQVLSPDGRYVLFKSSATNLAKNLEDRRWRTYLKDLDTGRLELLSPRVELSPVSPPDQTGNGVTMISRDLSRHAKRIVFDSNAPIGGISASQRRRQVYLVER